MRERERGREGMREREKGGGRKGGDPHVLSGYIGVYYCSILCLQVCKWKSLRLCSKMMNGMD